MRLMRSTQIAAARSTRRTTQRAAVLPPPPTAKDGKTNMGNFLGNLGWRIAQFMQGRNGIDTIAQYAIGAGIIFTIIDFFVNSLILSTLGLICLVYAIFRCYSKNISARALENAKFEAWVSKPKTAVSHARVRWANRATTKYFTCSQCGQSLSVPKGKGTLRVTCPKCRHQTTIKS